MPASRCSASTASAARPGRYRSCVTTGLFSLLPLAPMADSWLLDVIAIWPEFGISLAAASFFQ